MQSQVTHYCAQLSLAETGHTDLIQSVAGETGGKGYLVGRL